MTEDRYADRSGAAEDKNKNSCKVHPVKMPIELIPDSVNYEPIVFYEADTGKKHELYIESVTLYDPYREIQAYLNTPGLDRDAQADIAIIMTDHMIRHANDAPRYEICYSCEDAQIVFTEKNAGDKADCISMNPAFSNALAFLGASVYSPDNSTESTPEPDGEIGGRQTAIIQYNNKTDSRLALFIESCFTF